MDQDSPQFTYLKELKFVRWTHCYIFSSASKLLNIVCFILWELSSNTFRSWAHPCRALISLRCHVLQPKKIRLSFLEARFPGCMYVDLNILGFCLLPVLVVAFDCLLTALANPELTMWYFSRRPTNYFVKTDCIGKIISWKGKLFVLTLINTNSRHRFAFLSSTKSISFPKWRVESNQSV